MMDVVKTVRSMRADYQLTKTKTDCKSVDFITIFIFHHVIYANLESDVKKQSLH